MDKRWKGGVEVEGCVDLKVSNGEGEGEEKERERERNRETGIETELDMG